MSNWFSEKVGNWVKEAKEAAKEAPRRVQAANQQRTAAELSTELEAQARRVATPQQVVEVLSRWLERCEGNQGAFSLGLGEPLSFYQVLLRSRAFENLVDACGRVPALRHAIRSASEAGSDADPSQAMLAAALRATAERVLLPGALTLWPSLLEVLLASTVPEGDENAGALGGTAATKALESMCGPWSARALALLKRRWQNEVLPIVLRRLDRQLAESASKPVTKETDASSDLLRPALGSRMTKKAIRMALGKDQLQRHTADAARCRAQLDIMCEACEQLHAAEGAGGPLAPEVERLLEDADKMLTVLDTGVKERNAEQDALKEAMGEASSPLEVKIAQVKETLSSFTSKRAQLQEERNGLARRLEELDMNIGQLDQARGACEKEERQLRLQLRDMTNRYEDRIAGSFCEQKRMADEKLRAVACIECAHMALDVVRGEEKRFTAELAMQLQRRRAELQRRCAAYVHHERLRFAAAMECIEAASPKNQAATGSTDATQTLSIAQDAWRGVQAVLQRVELLLPDSISTPAIASDNAADAATKAAVQEQSGGTETVAVDAPAVSSAAEAGQPSQAAAVEEDAQTFFAREAQRGQRCVDCDAAEADWASASYGTYLCMDCAGKHRGLGVHLSFVRSTTMDIWSREQLRRMQLGGTENFLKFLEPYVEIRPPPQTSAQLAARYGSRAAAYYRSRLDLLCDGGDCSSLVVPSPAEGILPADAAASANGATAGSGGASGSHVGAGPEGPDEQDADSTSIRSLAEERAALDGVFHKYRHLLRDSGAAFTPPDRSTHRTMSQAASDMPTDAVASSPAAPALAAPAAVCVSAPVEVLAEATPETPAAPPPTAVTTARTAVAAELPEAVAEAPATSHTIVVSRQASLEADRAQQQTQHTPLESTVSAHVTGDAVTERELWLPAATTPMTTPATTVREPSVEVPAVDVPASSSAPAATAGRGNDAQLGSFAAASSPFED